MRGAIKKFGLMPKLPYKQEEVRKVAEFLYDKKSTLPTWYKKHYEEKQLRHSVLNNSLPLSSAKVTFVHNNIPVNKINVFMVYILIS
jgi:hypothetical protein